MYRVIFVDDEPWVVKSLSRFIDWASYGFSVQAIFTDPFDALDAIKAAPPDVVFADIRMPGMHGLELCRVCQQSGIPSLFVLATAYADFEYAREAIEQHVFSYVLKPFEKQQLISVAGRLRDALDDVARERIYSALHTRILSSLTFGDDPSNTLDDTSQEFLRLYASGYAIAAVDAAATLDIPTLVSADHCIPLYGTRYILLFPSLDAAHHALSVLPSNRFRAGLCSGDPHSLSACIRASLTALYSANFCQTSASQLVYRERPSTFADPYASGIIGAVRTRNWSGAENAVSTLEKVCHTGEMQIDQVLQIYHMVLSSVCYLHPITGLSDAFYPFQDIYHLYSVFPTISMLCEHMRALLSVIRSNEVSDSGDDCLNEVLCYVQQHFQDNLTLEFLSSHFHISLSHLCRQFKKAAKMTFTEYLLTCRMSKAIELLQDTELSIAQISDRSGYADYFYFNKMFKKYTGHTPAGYRKDKELHESYS